MALFSQKNLEIEIKLSTGFSLNTSDRDKFFWLQPEFENSFPLDLGIYTKYNPVKRISVSIGSALVFNELHYSHNDFEKYQEESDLGNNPISLSHYRLNEEINSISLKIPIELQYRILKKFFVAGGGGFSHSFNQLIRNRNTFFVQGGIGSSGPRFGWEMFLYEPLHNTEVAISNSYLNENLDYPVFKLNSRTINLSLSYRLWEK